MLFDIKDYYCFIPLNAMDTKPNLVIATWPMSIDATKCKQVGTAMFDSNKDRFTVYCQDVEINWPKQRVLVNFILLPKNVTQHFNITITRIKSNEYFVGHSDIILDFAPPMKLQHIITCADMYKFIDAGGRIINKKFSGNFKLANIKISDTKFVSL